MSYIPDRNADDVRPGLDPAYQEALMMFLMGGGGGQIGGLPTQPSLYPGQMDMLYGAVPGQLNPTQQGNFLQDYLNIMFDPAVSAMTGYGGYGPDAFAPTTTYEPVPTPGRNTLNRYVTENPGSIEAYLAEQMLGGGTASSAIGELRKAYEANPEDEEVANLVYQLPTEREYGEYVVNWDSALDQAQGMEQTLMSDPIQGATGGIFDPQTGEQIAPAEEIVQMMDAQGNPTLVRVEREESPMAEWFRDHGLSLPSDQYTAEDFLGQDWQVGQQRFAEVQDEYRRAMQDFLGNQGGPIPQQGVEQDLVNILSGGLTSGGGRIFSDGMQDVSTTPSVIGEQPREPIGGGETTPTGERIEPGLGSAPGYEDVFRNQLASEGVETRDPDEIIMPDGSTVAGLRRAGGSDDDGDLYSLDRVQREAEQERNGMRPGEGWSYENGMWFDPSGTLVGHGEYEDSPMVPVQPNMNGSSERDRQIRAALTPLLEPGANQPHAQQRIDAYTDLLHMGIQAHDAMTMVDNPEGIIRSTYAGAEGTPPPSQQLIDNRTGEPMVSEQQFDRYGTYPDEVTDLINNTREQVSFRRPGNVDEPGEPEADPSRPVLGGPAVNGPYTADQLRQGSTYQMLANSSPEEAARWLSENQAGMGQTEQQQVDLWYDDTSGMTTAPTRETQTRATPDANLPTPTAPPGSEVQAYLDWLHSRSNVRPTRDPDEPVGGGTIQQATQARASQVRPTRNPDAPFGGEGQGGSNVRFGQSTGPPQSETEGRGTNLRPNQQAQARYLIEQTSATGRRMDEQRRGGRPSRANYAQAARRQYGGDYGRALATAYLMQQAGITPLQQQLSARRQVPIGMGLVGSGYLPGMGG